MPSPWSSTQSWIDRRSDGGGEAFAGVNLLPLPARNERGEGWGEGKPGRKWPSSPRPSPPAAGGEGEPCALSAVLSLNPTVVARGGAAFGSGNFRPMVTVEPPGECLSALSIRFTRAC